MKYHKKIIAVSLIVLIIFVCGVNAPFLPTAKADSPIVRIQGNARGTCQSTNTITITMDSAPTIDNLLVLCYGGYGTPTAPTINTITQNGVIWTLQTQKIAALYYQDACEIWVGVVENEASTTISIQLAATAVRGVADVCEYSGLASLNFLDKTSSSVGTGLTANSGTTTLTSQDNELYVGAIFSVTGSGAVSQSAPTNGFTLLDGESYDQVTLGYLEYIATAKGTANVQTTLNDSKPWLGCIVTLEASNPMPRFTEISVTSTVAGTEFTLSSYITDQVPLTNYIWSIDNGSGYVNQTLTAFESNPVEFSGTWNSTIGTRIKVSLYCGDVEGVWAQSSEFIFLLSAGIVDWYTASNEWINVTKADWSLSMRNGTGTSAAQNNIFFYHRYSNESMYGSYSWGIFWSEDWSNGQTHCGKGTVSVVYGDYDVLVVKRTRILTNLTFYETYTFWRNQDYFAYETQFNYTKKSTVCQPQIGLTIGDGTYSYAGIPLNPESTAVYTQHTNIPITDDIVEVNQEMPWMAIRDTKNGINASFGFLLTHWTPQWIQASIGAAGYELQWSSYISSPSTSFPSYVPANYSIQVGTVIYPYCGDDDLTWYSKTQDLAKALYSTHLEATDCADIAFSSASTTGVWGNVRANELGITNRVGGYYFRLDHNGLFLRNTTTVFNWYPGQAIGANGIYIRATGTEAAYNYPDFAMTNTTGTYYVGMANTVTNSSSDNLSTDATPVYLKMSASRAGYPFTTNINFTTAGNSDKFNVTLTFTLTEDANISTAYTYFRAGAGITFNQLSATVADYTANDIYGGTCGYLFEHTGGNGTGVTYSSVGAEIIFVNGEEATYTAGTSFTVQLMLWGHFGEVTNVSQITPYESAPTFSSNQHFAASLSNPLLMASNVWNASATFPSMFAVDSQTYNLVCIAPEAGATYTVFLSTSIFDNNITVNGVESYIYDSATGRLTFTVSGGTNYIQILTNYIQILEPFLFKTIYGISLDFINSIQGVPIDRICINRLV